MIINQFTAFRFIKCEYSEKNLMLMSLHLIVFKGLFHKDDTYF